MNSSGTPPSSPVGPARSRSDHAVTTSPPGPAGGAARRRRRAGAARSGPGVRRPAVAPVVAELHHLHAELTAQSSLAPGPRVDELFHRLVELTVSLGLAEAAAVLAEPEVQALRPHLQRLCATGEAELERMWAARIAASPSAPAELDRFPYLENYRLLVALEWSAVQGAAGRRPPARVAFVGSGPLPLSPLLLANDHAVIVDGFDRDRRAVAQSQAVIAALAPDVPLRIRHGDTTRCPDLRAYDVVVLAALVGSTPAAKRAVIRRVGARMRPGALLVARSAHGARTLLYPVLDLEALTGLDLLSVVHPLNQVINSIVLARTRAGGDPTRRATMPAPNDEVRPWPGSS
jgi:hypothetical protein